MHTLSSQAVPYKSMAVGLLLAVFLGPVGLLYASIWGGIVGSVFLWFMFLNKYYFLAAVVWFLGCCYAVRSVEKYNKILFNLIID